MYSAESFRAPAPEQSLVDAPLPTAEWSISDGAAKVNAGWSSCLGTFEFPLDHVADQAGIILAVFASGTGESALDGAALPTVEWSIPDGTAKVNAGWSSWLGTFDPNEENWPVSIYTPPPDWSCLFDGLGDMWIETARFLDFLSEAESLTEFLAGAGYITGFTSDVQSETRLAISAAAVVRFDAASETEFLPELCPSTPNWGSGVITLPPLRRRNYGF